jgi:DNA repair photolyase
MGTWNPITGCLHECSYCWARSYARKLASWGIEPYKTYGFKPAFAEWRLRQRLPREDFIFVSDMGDMWGNWVPKEWIEKVLRALRSKNRSNLFFLTKNPKRYGEFIGMLRENMILGVTIETNRNYNLTKAPTPWERFEEIRKLNWRRKAVVIEPILDFDLEFIGWIKEIRPEFVRVGYDNYGCKLPEPTISKAKMFVKELQTIMEVEASGLRRAWFE